MESVYAFIGLMSGIILAFVIMFCLVEVQIPQELIKNKSMDYNNIHYTVLIDSSATDSLYGKTWRNNK